MTCPSPGLMRKELLKTTLKDRRVSNASIYSQESSLLDEFPLPEEFMNYHVEQSSDAAETSSSSSCSIPKDLNSSAQSSTYSMQYSPIKAPAPRRKSSAVSMSQTERRYLRYGHSYNSSWSEQRSKSTNTHSASHSWDAGAGDSNQFWWVDSVLFAISQLNDINLLDNIHMHMHSQTHTHHFSYHWHRIMWID